MRKAGDIITALFRERFGPEFIETARTSSGLFSSWEKIVAEIWPYSGDPGLEDIPAAAVHSRIRELERGVLLVEADHPGWVQILLTKQTELLSAVQRRYPKLGIQAIAFRLNREPFSPQGPEERIPFEASTSIEVKTPKEVKAKGENKNLSEAKTSSASRNASKDEEFYTALKGLEESVRKRNR
jgi:hypothetical protein